MPYALKLLVMANQMTPEEKDKEILHARAPLTN
jgi:hypothetical protein